MEARSKRSSVIAAAVIGAFAICSGMAPRAAAASEPTTAELLTQNFLASTRSAGASISIPPICQRRKPGRSSPTGRSSLPFNGQAPQVPTGFTATPFATGLANPRRLLVLPNGDVLVAEQSAGYLTLLRDEGDGPRRVDHRHVEDLNRPYGLAWQDDHVLVADQDGIWRVPHVVGALRAGRPVPPQTGRAGAARAAQAGARRLWRRDDHEEGRLRHRPGPPEPRISRSTRRPARLFVGVGSSGNLGIEPEPKATIQRFDADGSNQTTYASGMRNPTALAFHPQTGDLWAVVQERDGLGDNLPSDYLIRVQEGGFYGWPYAYIGKHPQPGFAQLAPDKVKATITPDLLFEAHSSLLDLVFYEGDQFPAEYKGSVFVALKGSWNRSVPTGYKVVRRAVQGRQAGRLLREFRDRVLGVGRERAEVWGRPAALAVAKDGSLLIADDTGGTIWRISYTGTGSSPAASNTAGSSDNPSPTKQ